MIAAIENAITTDETLLNMLRFVIGNNLSNLQMPQLQAICTVLGIDTTAGGS